jgi:hypothetical protein
MPYPIAIITLNNSFASSTFISIFYYPLKSSGLDSTALVRARFRAGVFIYETIGVKSREHFMSFAWFAGIGATEAIPLRVRLSAAAPRQK